MPISSFAPSNIFSEGSNALGEVIALPNNRFAAFGSKNDGSLGTWATFERYNPSGSSTIQNYTFLNCYYDTRLAPCGFSTADLSSTGLIIMGGTNGNGHLVFRGLDSNTWEQQNLWGGQFTPVVSSAGQQPVAVEWLNPTTFVALANSGTTSPFFKLMIIGVGAGHVNTDGYLVPTGTISDTSITGSDMTLQSDGKIVAIGTFADTDRKKIVIRRYSSGLTPDSTFGNSGSVTTDLGSNATAKKLAVQPDGKLLVACDLEIDSVRRFAVVRYNSNGSVDTAFGINGVAAVADSGAKNIVTGLAIQSDGKIVISGYKGSDGWGAFDYADFQISRINSDGSIDLNYGTLGSSFFAPAWGLINRSLAMTLDSSDRAVLVGASGITPFVPRGIVRVLGNTQEPPPAPSNSCTDELFDNGPLITHPGAGPNGADISRVQTSLGLNTAAYVNTRGWAIADDFVVPAGGWQVDRIKFYSYFSSSAEVNTSVNSAHIRILNNSPDSQGVQIVWGDADLGISNNRKSSNFANIYRDRESAPGNSAGPVMEVVANVGTFLPAGHYWVEVQIESGEAVNGIPFVTVLGSTGKPGANALQRNPTFGTWSQLRDSGSSAAMQDIPFKVLRSRSCNAAKPPIDLDGDQKTDLSIFRPNGASSEWWWMRSSNGTNGAVVFGANTDTIVPADYTGDGKTDIAFWRPSNGNWFVLRSEDFSFFAFPFGSNGDVPVPADYDGDGKADPAVFRGSAATWYVNKSSGGTDIIPFGAVGDKPVPGDFDGDGKGDLAVFRPNGGTGTEWWVRRSSNGSSFALQFGSPTDKAVPGDYTGDGKTDVAFWRPSNGNWFVLRSEDFSFFAFPFGANGDTPVPGDYDGDGRWDAGVFRPSNANWYVQRSTAGTLIQQFGNSGDTPLPSAYVR